MVLSGERCHIIDPHGHRGDADAKRIEPFAVEEKSSGTRVGRAVAEFRYRMNGTPACFVGMLPEPSNLARLGIHAGDHERLSTTRCEYVPTLVDEEGTHTTGFRRR
jgi:hypothetical protein